MNFGIEMIIINKKTNPIIKSTQLPKSCQKPREDFDIMTIARNIKNFKGKSNPVPKIKIAPIIMSKTPNNFISIFFKYKTTLKN